MDNRGDIKKFVDRMEKLGIDVKLVNNYPWIYLTSINGIPVRENFKSNHGFTLAFHLLSGKGVKFTDLDEIFKLIRKYKNLC